jgi:hypothetical protein
MPGKSTWLPYRQLYFLQKAETGKCSTVFSSARDAACSNPVSEAGSGVGFGSNFPVPGRSREGLESAPIADSLSARCRLPRGALSQINETRELASTRTALADVAQADYAQGLAAKVSTDGGLPSAIAHRCGFPIEVSHARQDQRPGEFDRGSGIVADGGDRDTEVVRGLRVDGGVAGSRRGISLGCGSCCRISLVSEVRSRMTQTTSKGRSRSTTAAVSATSSLNTLISARRRTADQSASFSVTFW